MEAAVNVASVASAPPPPQPPPAPVVDLDAAARALADTRVVSDGETATVWQLPTGHYDSRAYPLPGGRMYEGGLNGTIRLLNSDGKLAWEKAAGDNGLSVTPAVAPDGTAYVSRVVAVEAWAPDGTRRWHSAVSDSLSLQCAAGPEGNCYVFDGTRLLALDGRDGRVLWKHPLQSDWCDEPPLVGKDGTVYCADKDSVVWAFRPDGKVRWHYDGVKTPGKGFKLADVTTHLAVGDDGSVYFGHRSGKLIALDPDGHEKWQAPLASAPDLYESPSVDGHGVVYAGEGRDNTAVAAFDPQDGHELWRRDAGSVLHVTGIPQGGVVVGIKGGPLQAFAHDGTPQWTFHSGNTFTRPSFGADGAMYTGAGQKLYAVTADTATTAERQQRIVERAVADSGEPKATPTIESHDGWVIIGNVRVPRRS